MSYRQPGRGRASVISSGPPSINMINESKFGDNIVLSKDDIADQNKSFFDSHDVMETYHVLVPTVFSIVVALGIVGNVLVIYVILSRHKLRHVWNLLLMNLAIADITFLLTSGVFTTVHFMTVEWPFGDVFCRVTQYTLYVTCYVSVYTLVVVSAVRYYITLRGAVSPMINSQKNILLLIAAIWVMFLATQVPVAMIHGETQMKGHNATECIATRPAGGRIMFASFFTFAYAVPFLIILVIYTLLVIHLKKQPMPVNEKKGDKRNKHVTNVVTAVIVVFALCWLPLHVHLLIGSFGRLPHNFHYRIATVFWYGLVFLNSALNPLLYNFLSTEFRESFREVVCCAFATKFKWSSLRSSKSTSSTTGGDNP